MIYSSKWKSLTISRETLLKFIILLLIAYFAFVNNSSAVNSRDSEPIKVPKITTPPAIDGKLDETIWTHATTVSNFIQRFPKDGERATEKTEVYFMYTTTDLFVGIRCFDAQPE
jgi:hypothetical protein